MLRPIPLLLLASMLLNACGDDGSTTDSAVDSGADTGTADSGMDTGVMDAGADADGDTGMDATLDAGDCDFSEPGTAIGDVGASPVTITGVVSTPGTPLPGNIPSGTPLLDAGMDVDAGVVRQEGGELVGATVTLLGPDFSELARDQTDCMGRFQVPGPSNTSPLFLRVDPVPGVGGGYTGYVRARATDDRDLNAGQMTLLLVPELNWRLSMIGQTYDFDDGWVVQSFASTRTPGGGLEGGEGVNITGATNGPAFVVTGTRTIETSTLPPECDTDTDAGVPPGEPVLLPDGGVQCYTDLLELVFVSSVQPPGPVQIELVDPPGKVCTQRETVADWPVFPNTVNRARADCE